MRVSGNLARAIGHGRNRAKFWAKLDYVSAKLAGYANAARAKRRYSPRPRYCHSVLLTDEEWEFTQLLASEASDREHRWITAHGYLRRVILDHLDREAARIRLEMEHEAERERQAKLEAKAAKARR